MSAVFLRVLESDTKDEALKNAITSPAVNRTRFDVDTATFSDVPRSPFAYWISDRVRRLFSLHLPFESSQRQLKQGLITTDDFRFVRAWWEVGPHASNRPWVPFAKGGSASGFYNDLPLCVDWLQDGAQSWAIYEARRHVVGGIIKNPEFYFEPGVSWALRTARFAPSCVPRGCIFSGSRQQAFISDDVLSAVALLNSEMCTALLRISSEWFSRPKFVIGIVKTLPFPALTNDDAAALAARALHAWRLKRHIDSAVETSRVFLLPGLVRVDGGSISERLEAWRRELEQCLDDLARLQAAIDDHAFDLYRVDEEDRHAISEGYGVEQVDDTESDDEDSREETAPATDAQGLVAEFLSWAVGVAFGRFDVRLATGEREAPGQPEPFDPLPVCPPGMLAGEDGLPLAAPPPGYSLGFPTDGILVDDPGDARHLTAAVRAVFDVVFGASADARWDEAAALLDPRGHDLRAWLRSEFSEHHLKLYSKSRRKAPIMWQLGTPSGRYSVWLYAHRLTDDSFFQLQNDVLAPKLAYEERQLTNLVQSSGGSHTATDRREIDAQERFVEELRVMLEEVKRVAPLWRPTLDDGFVLVMAPLRRLVPHKPWKRELKKKWCELAAGKYDWAQLAMHLWPERVVPKCREDRSLAIAHGLEDVFWSEDEDGKWQQRDEPTTAISDLIQERTSAAVKDALGALA